MLRAPSTHDIKSVVVRLLSLLYLADLLIHAGDYMPAFVSRANKGLFVILAQTPLIPYCTFVSSEKADPKLVAKVRQALLELKPADTVELNGERVKVMKAAWVDGYEELPVSAYDPIREMARRTNMPPFQKL
jgi:ABC-type phosphate/phosphonate transport system substrate-binding protein